MLKTKSVDMYWVHLIVTRTHVDAHASVRVMMTSQAVAHLVTNW
jgi:hypothetical protein